MTAADLYSYIAADLAEYCESVGAVFSRAQDPLSVYELLMATPDSFTVVFFDAGDKEHGQARLTAVTEYRYQVTVHQPEGLPVAQGPNTVTLLGRVDQVRDRLRTLKMPVPDTCGFLRYMGRKGVIYKGHDAAVDGYELDFSTLAGLPAVEPTRTPTNL